MRRCRVLFVLGCAGLLTMLCDARGLADHQPALVVPGRLTAPIVIEGRDASWAVVEGDWGLYRPGHVGPTVYPYALLIYPPAPGFYFPTIGKRPRSGRHEARVRSKPRTPAQNFYRSWSTDAPVYLPPVIEAPRSW